MNYLIKVYKHAHSTYTFLIIINPTKQIWGNTQLTKLQTGGTLYLELYER